MNLLFLIMAVVVACITLAIVIIRDPDLLDNIADVLKEYWLIGPIAIIVLLVYLAF